MAKLLGPITDLFLSCLAAADRPRGELAPIRIQFEPWINLKRQRQSVLMSRAAARCAGTGAVSGYAKVSRVACAGADRSC
jgi:hypothetical protein